MFEAMSSIEAQGINARERGPASDAAVRARNRIVLLFVIVFLGVVASWLWEGGWSFVVNPPTNPRLPTGAEFALVLLITAVRLGLSAMAAVLIFRQVYLSLKKPSVDGNVIPFLAFEGGFAWQSAIGAITGPAEAKVAEATALVLSALGLV